MAAVGQNFQGYVGDDLAPVISVLSATNAPIDISAAAEITWTLVRAGQTILTKTKSGGAITFDGTNGVDGQFTVAISAVDTAALLGSYTHISKIRDTNGKTTTVTVGSVSFGYQPTWTFDPGAMSGVSTYAQLMQIRSLIGDINSADRQLWDEQINFTLAQRGNIYNAGADCCRILAAKYSRDVDITEGFLRKNYTARSKAYSTRAEELDQRGRLLGAGLPYAGGISRTDKQIAATDADRVQPQFSIGMTDNWLPVSPVDNENDLPNNGPLF